MKNLNHTSLITKAIATLFMLASTASVSAVSFKTISANATTYMQKNNDGVLASMRLKRMRVGFNSLDISSCGKNMKRIKGTLRYSCQIPFYTGNVVAKFKQLKGGTKKVLPLATKTKNVFVHISDDAKYIKFVTEYPTTSLDLDFVKFNKEFFDVYSTLSHKLFIDLMTKRSFIVDIYTSESQRLSGGEF